MSRLLLLAQLAQKTEVVQHEHRGGRSHDPIDGLRLFLNELDKLCRKLDIGRDPQLCRTCGATDLIAHALQAEIGIDDGLEKPEIRCDRPLGSDEVVADRFEVRAARIDLVRLLPRCARELLVSRDECAHGIVEGEVNRLVDREHLVACLHELAMVQLSHGLLLTSQTEYKQVKYTRGGSAARLAQRIAAGGQGATPPPHSTWRM